jgi:hypothetical protein
MATTIIHNNTCECERAKGIFFFDYTNKKIIKASCKAYICPTCGPRKISRFRTALQKYLNTFSFIRLFTFTQHTPDELNIEFQNKNMSKVWELFIKELRRSKKLTKKQKNAQYVRVVEFTERGYIHFHICFDTFLPILHLRELWNNALATIFPYYGNRGGINIKTIANSKHVANYLTKYMVKSAEKEFGNIRRWSKSNKISIFEKFVNPNEVYFLVFDSSGLLNLNVKSITPQKKDGKFIVSPSELLRKSIIFDALLETIEKNVKTSSE